MSEYKDHRDDLALDDELHDRDDDDLTYYAKPENYQGTKDSMRRFLSTHLDSATPIGRDSSSVIPDPRKKILKDWERKPSSRVISTWNSNDGRMSSANYFRRNIRDSGDGQPSSEESLLTDNASENDDHGLRELNERGRSPSRQGNARRFKSHFTKQMARERIRRAISIVLINMRWIAIVEKEERKSGEAFPASSPSQKTFTDIASEQTITDDGFTFDPSSFKARKEAMITSDLRRILTTPSWTRTSEEIQTAVYGLQHLDAFAEYPLHMRQKLCQVGWFQQVSPKRVIIRQGQPPENFYFVLSGQAVVRFLEQNSLTGANKLRTASVLRRGNSFGELALLHRTRRTATVISQDVVQLLAIGKEDFFQIIMGLSPDGSVPDHIQFLSSMDFMDDWPIHLLAKNPDQCMFLYFKRGTVMVKDSTNSDWIYVVKSGSCKVMKQLVAVAPHTLQQRRSVAEQQIYPSLPNASSDRKSFENIPRNTSKKRNSTRESLPRLSYNINVPKCTNRPEQPPDGASKRVRRYSYAGIPLDVLPPSDDLEGVRTFKPIESVFIQVETLLPRRIFGLRNINFAADFEPSTGSEASFSLVSNGAECVILSKRFFIEHSNPGIRRRIESQVSPYPSDRVLQQNLQLQVNWNAYKQRLVHSCVTSRISRQNQGHT